MNQTNRYTKQFLIHMADLYNFSEDDDILTIREKFFNKKIKKWFMDYLKNYKNVQTITELENRTNLIEREKRARFLIKLFKEHEIPTTQLNQKFMQLARLLYTITEMKTEHGYTFVPKDFEQ
ncbi:MAG: hypothetical protein E7374_00850 [Clostridiales bacterium]|nr:hypothetical protein [Clostridiales bacterium]